MQPNSQPVVLLDWMDGGRLLLLLLLLDECSGTS
jgi:hypothetical protein